MYLATRLLVIVEIVAVAPPTLPVILSDTEKVPLELYTLRTVEFAKTMIALADFVLLRMISSCANVPVRDVKLILVVRS